MKFPNLPILAATLPLHAYAGDGVLDLTRLANYANQPIPNHITRNNTTAGNAITDRGTTLGRVLFHDKRLSRDNTVSCSSCHAQSRAFGDSATASTGVSGTTGRHSMRLVNARPNSTSTPTPSTTESLPRSAEERTSPTPARPVCATC